jgi:hypothetical protein
MPLREFRERLYGCLDKRVDALFELIDAVLTSGHVTSPVHLSLASVHRRSWVSLYAALEKGRIDVEAMRDLLVEQIQGDGLPENGPAVYVVDRSVWARCDAEASPERGYYHHPSRHSAGQPIVAGWCYQLIAQLGFSRDSWISPVDVRRVKPEEDANDIATGQIGALRRRLPEHLPDPLFVFDAGYDPVRLQRQLGECPAQLLVRLHSDRVFYADPEVPEKQPVGRPFRHGERFDLKDPQTWPTATVEHSSQDPDHGSLRVRAWSWLHPKTRRAGERYSSDTAAVVRGTVILVEVERLPRGERRRTPKKLWLWWHGHGEPDLELLWKSYVRRFDIEHGVKLLKSSLGRTTPRFRHPEQADRWTWLVIVAYAQLLLARGIIADQRLPWERPLSAQLLTPTRVLRNFATLLATLGTPAEAPKPRGRSPGRPKGSLSEPARRYPAVKKAA